MKLLRPLNIIRLREEGEQKKNTTVNNMLNTRGKSYDGLKVSRKINTRCFVFDFFFAIILFFNEVVLRKKTCLTAVLTICYYVYYSSWTRLISYDDYKWERLRFVRFMFENETKTRYWSVRTDNSWIIMLKKKSVQFVFKIFNYFFCKIIKNEIWKNTFPFRCDWINYERIVLLLENIYY